MAEAPLMVFFITALIFAFQFMHPGFQGELPSFDPAGKISQVNNSTTAQETGFLSGVVGVVTSIWDLAVLFFDLVTVNIEGAPTPVRFVAAVTLGGGNAWSVARLIRG